MKEEINATAFGCLDNSSSILKTRNLKVTGHILWGLKWPGNVFSGNCMPCMGFHGFPKQGEGISGRYKKLTW